MEKTFRSPLYQAALLILAFTLSITPLAAKSGDTAATVGVLPFLIPVDKEDDVLTRFERYYFAKQLIEKLSVTKRISGAYLVPGGSTVDIIVSGEISKSTADRLELAFDILAPDGSTLLGDKKLLYQFKIKKRKIKKQIEKQRDPFADAWVGVAEKVSKLIKWMPKKSLDRNHRAILGIHLGTPGEIATTEQATEKALVISQELQQIEADQLLAPQTKLFAARVGTGETTYWAWRKDAHKLYKKKLEQDRASKNFAVNTTRLDTDVAAVYGNYSGSLRNVTMAITDLVAKQEVDFTTQSEKLRSNVKLRLQCEDGKAASCAPASLEASKAGDLDLGSRLSSLGCKSGDGYSCFILSKIQEQKGNTAKAIEAAQTGCKLKYTTACEIGAQLELGLKHVDLARQFATRGCESDSGASCLQLGQIASMAGNRSGEMSAFERACELEIPEGCALLAKVAEADNDYQKQISAGSTGCDLNHGESCVLASLGEARLHRISRAQNFAVRGCELNWPESCNVLAKIENHWGRFDKAIVAAEKACNGKIEEACEMARKIRFEKFGQ